MKALFERLIKPVHTISTKKSIINNIENIIRFGSYLDAGVDSISGGVKSIYHNGLLSVVDVSLEHQQQVVQFNMVLVQLVKMYEPRIKDIQVLDIKTRGFNSSCQLKIFLFDEEFEEEFVFE